MIVLPSPMPLGPTKLVKKVMSPAGALESFLQTQEKGAEATERVACARATVGHMIRITIAARGMVFGDLPIAPGITGRYDQKVNKKA